MSARAWAASVLLLTLAGCGSAASPTGPATAPATAPTSKVTMSGFTNPVHAQNFPDPQIVADGGGFVAVATNGNGMNVQTLTSSDMVTWSQGSDALPTLPSWSAPGKVWAPETIRRPDGTWRMYYTTRGPDLEHQCISVASATAARGPYVDDSSRPLVCEVAEGGSIDASPFIASDGRAYLYWKNDGNHIGVDSFIKVAPLSPDGRSLAGPTTRLFRQDRPWEGKLVEAPFVREHDGRFHLFYSGNDYGSDAYAVGHAVATSPTGPFRKDPEPVLRGNDVAAGPGHCALLDVGGRTWMVYHAWQPDAVGDELTGRRMWLSRVTFGADGAVTVEPPTASHPTAPQETS